MRLHANLTALLRTSIDGVLIVDGAGTVQGWNCHAEAIFGWAEGEALDRSIADLVVPQPYRPGFLDSVRDAVSGRDTKPIGTRFEFCAEHRDGRAVPIELGVVSVEQDGAQFLIGFVRDLTEQHRAAAELEQAQAGLRESEERYRQIVELSGMIAWTADLAGRIVSVGQRWTDWTGATTDAAIGDGWMSFLHRSDIAEVARSWAQTVQASTQIDIDYRLRRHDGEYRWVNARATKRHDGDPQGTIWYGTLEDVHDRRLADEAFQKTQAELAHVSRLSAMGAMASAIAHDLNQPLTAAAHYVRGSRRLAQGLAGDKLDMLLGALDDADRSIVRAGDIVRRVRDFVSRGAVERRVEALGELVEEACRFTLLDAADRQVSYSLGLAIDCPVLVDRVQVQQVLVNLIRNAVQAMQDQPRRELTISTRRRETDCEVAISDTGVGVTPEAAARLFDPFYTTRSDGMGIGLSISRTLIESHGGALWLDETMSAGTTFRFTLPLASESLPG